VITAAKHLIQMVEIEQETGRQDCIKYRMHQVRPYSDKMWIGKMLLGSSNCKAEFTMMFEISLFMGKNFTNINF